MTTPSMTEYTAPGIYAAVAAGEPWADPVTDPTLIDWAPRTEAALVPFRVVDGRPVNPLAPTGVRRGRNECGHWGEAACADAAVVLHDVGTGRPWLAMIERGDSAGSWALPGGHMDPGESPTITALRELWEETGLRIDPATLPGDLLTLAPRVVPDTRASDEAWMATVPVVAMLGRVRRPRLTPDPRECRRAAWVPVASLRTLRHWLGGRYNGSVCPAHADLVTEIITLVTADRVET